MFGCRARSRRTCPRTSLPGSSGWAGLRASRYLEAARRSLEAFFPFAGDTPGGIATFLMAFEEHLESPTSINLRGSAA